MARHEHLEQLKTGTAAWNQWREQNLDTRPDLTGADLTGTVLTEIDFSDTRLSYARLRGAEMSRATLVHADLMGADLSYANLEGANLNFACLSGARLIGARLSNVNLLWANLTSCDLTDADLSQSELQCTTMVQTNFTNANLAGCRVYGVAAWDLKLDGANQSNLRLSRFDAPLTIAVDNLELAQFIYLLLASEKIRSVLDTITSKLVLILGRFTPERKPILDALRQPLRSHGYVPVLCDFEKPMSRDVSETVSILAHMARFVIADLTDARSVPQELENIVPHLPSVPVQPILRASEREYAMFDHFRRYPWVLKTYAYADVQELLRSFEEQVIAPAEAKLRQIRRE